MSLINVKVADPSEQNNDSIVTPNTSGQDDAHISVPNTGSESPQEQGNSALVSSFGIIIIMALLIFISIMIIRKKKIISQSASNTFKINATSTQKVAFGCLATFVVLLLAIFCHGEEKQSEALGSDDDKLSITVEDINITAIPGVSGKEFAVGSGTVTVNTPTKFGYTLYVNASSHDLVQESNSENKIAGLAESDDPTALTTNTWGLALSSPTDKTSEVWWRLPNTEEDPFVIKETNSANDNTTRVYYGVNVDNSLPKGTYKGTLNYIALANVDPSTEEEGEDDTTYVVSFDIDNGSNRPEAQYCSATADLGCQITIPSTIPTRENYDFLGWAETSGATTAVYQPGETMTITSSKTLYAVWQWNSGAAQVRYIFTLSYNANGGTNTPNSHFCTITDSGCTATISSITPTRTNYEFLGWSETTSATTASYHSGDTITLSSSKTLYAIWQWNGSSTPTERSFTLTYNNNGGTNGPNEETLTTTGDSISFTISTVQPTRTDYNFKGWCSQETSNSTCAGTIYQGGDSIILSSSKALYAIWEAIPKTYTLSYNANGGSSAPNAQPCTTTSPNCEATISSVVPTRTNYRFLGWAESASATTVKYKASDRIMLSDNKTLYAIWDAYKTAVHFINLGDHGNATLLESNGTFALVDTGKSASWNRVDNYLKKKNVNKLAFVIISHIHNDHADNLKNLLYNYEVGKVYMKEYTGLDNGNTKYNTDNFEAIKKAAGSKIVYVDKNSDFKEADNKYTSITLEGMNVTFFNTKQRIVNTKKSGEKFNYYKSNYWAGKGENLNSIANLISANGHNVLLTGDLNNYDILSYVLKERVSKFLNNQKFDVYSVPHHGNWNCTGNKPMQVKADYYLVTNSVDSTYNGKYRISNEKIDRDGEKLDSCFKQMNLNFRDAYYSVVDSTGSFANTKGKNSDATVFTLSGNKVTVNGGFKGSELTDRQ